MTEQERLRILYGDPGLASPERVPLRAGPLSLDYTHGDLRYVRWGAHEIVRRIYAAVRDENWGTVPLHLEETERVVETDRFRIVYEGRYAAPEKDIDFRSVVTLTGAPDGTVTFDFDGEALSTFRRNRIGVCVLHPTPEVAGKFVRVTHADGHETSGFFPETISPHQPFFNIAALDYEVESGVRAHIAFSGDVFEMEDQRNWLDASFKTYSTPHALPKPVTVDAGTRVHQRVTLSLRGAEAREGVRTTESRRAITVSAAIDREAERPFRHPGLVLPPDASLPDRLLPAVRALKPDHLRIDVDAAKEGWQSVLQRADERAAALGVDLLVALRGAEALADVAVPNLSRVVGWLLVHPTAEGVRAARAALPGAARILAGTSANFTELNRSRPLAEDIDGVFFAGNPQVHAFDSLSILETPPTLAHAIATAREFHAGRIAVGPLPLSGSNHDGADPRHASLFGAAWYLSAFAAAADAGANRVTLCDIAGPRGVLNGDGRPTPAGSVLAELPANPTSHLAHVKVSDGNALSGLALWANDGHAWLFVVNRTDRPVPVVLHGLGAGRPSLRVMDETTGGGFLTRDVEDSGDGSQRLTLNPYAVIKYATEPQHR